MWRFTVFFPPGAPCKGVCYTSLRGRGPVHCWPDPLWKPSEALDEIQLLDAWPLDVGRSDSRCDTLGSSWKPPSSSHVLSLEAAESSLSLPKPVQKFNLGTGTCVSANHHSWLLRKEYSVRPRVNAVKCHVISAAVWLWYFTDQSLYAHKSNSNEIITQWGLASESFQFQCNLWESHDLTLRPVITYIYLCGWIYASCSLRLKPSFSNKAETEFKCNTGFRQHVNLAFYHIQTVGA